MAPNYTYRLTLALIVFTLLFVACNQANPPNTTPTATIPPTPQPTLNVVESFSFEPERAITIPPHFQNWDFNDAYNPAQPHLFQWGTHGFSLVDTWHVAKIEYVYEWGGLGGSVFDYQAITAANGTFTKQEETIDAEKITRFLASLSDLHLAQTLMSGQSHTDDYPSWTVEVTGTDGRRLQIFSTSTGNPGSGPWVIYADGRFYGQYNGKIGATIGDLFTGRLGKPAAAYFPGDREEGQVIYSVGGWPFEIYNVQSGLLPLKNGLTYIANITNSQIQGRLLGRSATERLSHMVIGQIVDVQAVTLNTTDTKIECTIESVDIKNDPAGLAWSFVCPISDWQMGERYQYPITISFTTEDEQTWTTDGLLIGSWSEEERLSLQPLPAEIQQAIAQNQVAQELMAQHIPYLTGYTANRDILRDQHILVGQLHLLGETTQNGRPIRYTLSTPFAVENGEFTYLTLTTQKAEEFVASVIAQPVTQKVLGENPDTIINLHYDEWGGTTPEISSGRGFQIGNYRLTLPQCGDQPHHDLPNRSRPLTAFSLNGQWFFHQIDFALIDGEAVIAKLDLYPYQTDRDGILDHLIPQELQTADPMFERIGLKSSSYDSTIAELVIRTPDDVSATERAELETLIKGLPGRINEKYAGSWSVTDVSIEIDDVGELHIIACD